MKLCAFDVETGGREARFLGGAWASERGAEYVTDRDQWLEVLREHAAAGYSLVAHNAEYDITRGLWPAGEDVTVHYFNGVFTVGFWRWRKRGPAAKIIDSMNLAAGLSLAKLGQSLGYPKLPRPKVLTAKYQGQAWAWENGVGSPPEGWSPPPPDRFDWFCERHAIGECVRCYAVRDAEIALRYTDALTGLLEGYGIVPATTLAGNAIKLWSYFDAGMQLGIRSEKVRELARRSYHGGRCENFQFGTFDQVYTYDRRAHYLAIMRTAELPDPRFLFYVDRAPRELRLDGIEGVIEATVETDYRHIPLLPAVAAGAIYYPIGRFSGVYTLVELRAALAAGYRLIETGAMAWSARTVRPFGVFAEAVLGMRSELRAAGDPAEQVWKTLGNAPAGRLGTNAGGEKRVYQRRVRGLTERQRQGSELHFAGDTAYLSRIHRVPTAPRGSNVLWASYITSLGRLALQRDLEAAGDTLLYCDTDSVMATAPLPTGPDEAGELRDTGTYAQGVFLAPKLYRLETYEGVHVVRAKGVPAQVADDYFIEGKAIYETSLGVIEAIARNIEPGRWEPVERARMLTPARRQPVNPAALIDRDQTSETDPIVFAGSDPGPAAPISSARAAR